ncbi:MAG: beta-aspartyl-peptidase [Gammaproteobacteria bacterium]
MLKLLENAQIYSPNPTGFKQLLVADGRIAWIGDAPLSLPEHLNVEVVDCGGHRVIPGFIDSHAHVTGGGGESGFSSRVPAVELSRFTQSGVTTVVGLLGTDDTTRDTNALLSQTRALREMGLNAYCYTGGYHVPPVTLTGSVRKDIVHCDPIIGVGELAISDHRSSQPTLEEILRIASDAHVAGMITGKAGIVHFHMGDGDRGLDLIRQALDTSEIPARVFNPTHVNRRKALLVEACELAKRGCYVDITAFPVEDGEDAWSAKDALLRYLDSGAPADRVTISSDGGGCLPHFDHEGRIIHMDIGSPDSLPHTLAELLASGQSLESALPAFTSNAADLLRLSHKGRLETGYDADLIILDEANRPESVMINGSWHRYRHKRIIKGNFETAD